MKQRHVASASTCKRNHHRDAMGVLAAPLIAVLICVAWMHHGSLVAATSPTRMILEEVQQLTKQQAAAARGGPDYQAKALAAFASGLDADPFAVLPLWTGDSHPCGDISNNFRPWPGITCNAPTAYVTGISLSGKGLSGSLPDSISVLNSLRTLDLSDNAFHGSLPAVWSNLTSLELVDVSQNHLTGPLPAAFSAWDAMQTLELHHNMLTGRLPGGWAGMNLLEVLDLSSNQLNGSLPGCWARMNFLSVLSLQNNKLTGTLPVKWAKQHALLNLNLGSNRLEGLLPAEWAAGMDSLRVVNLTDNSLSGPLPGSWSNLTSLQALYLANNMLTGSIPAALGTLRNLHVINVTRNRDICGVMPSQMSDIIGSVNSTNVNNMCQWQADAVHLLALKAAVTDPSAALANWQQGSNPCGAQLWQGVSCFGGWVTSIRLEGESLQGQLTKGLVKVSNLQGLYLNNNQLTGTLPTSWGDDAVATLTDIDLSDNQLTGSLPDAWSRLATLQHVNLSANDLSGQLPEGWATMTNLTTLLLGSNRKLNGTLPASWAGLAALKQASLDSTAIQGSLPASWAKLTEMRQLRLSNNMLTGAVLTTWPTGMDQHLSLDLSGNQQMCGNLRSMPDTWDLQAAKTDLGKKCERQGISMTAAIAVGVCVSVGGTPLLTSAAYLILRNRQGPATQLAALRTMGTSTVGLTGSPSRPASPASSMSAMSMPLMSPPSSTTRSPTPVRLGTPTPSLVSPAPTSPAFAALPQQQHRLAYGSSAVVLQEKLISPRTSSVLYADAWMLRPASPIAAAAAAAAGAEPRRLFSGIPGDAAGSISRARTPSPEIDRSVGISGPQVAEAARYAMAASVSGAVAAIVEDVSSSSLAPAAAAASMHDDSPAEAGTGSGTSGGGSWQSSRIQTPQRTPAHSMPGSPAVGVWGSAVKACESSQGTPLGHRSGDPSTTYDVGELRARFERLLRPERPASPPAELGMSPPATTSYHSMQRYGPVIDGYDAAAATPVLGDEEAAAAADASPVTAAMPAAAAASSSATTVAVVGAGTHAAASAGGEAVAAAGAAADATADEEEQSVSNDDDLDESAVTGSAGMAQAPLVAVALGGSQSLAWPGSPGGGGASPAGMLLMGSGLPSPRGVAALMARTPQRAGLANAAAAPAEAEADVLDLKAEVVQDVHSD